MICPLLSNRWTGTAVCELGDYCRSKVLWLGIYVLKAATRLGPKEYIHKSKKDLFSILAGAAVVRVHASEASYGVDNLIISKPVLRSSIMNLSSYLSLKPDADQEMRVHMNGTGRYQISEADTRSFLGWCWELGINLPKRKHLHSNPSTTSESELYTEWKRRKGHWALQAVKYIWGYLSRNVYWVPFWCHFLYISQILRYLPTTLYQPMGLFCKASALSSGNLSEFNARIHTPPTHSPPPLYAAEITIYATNLAVLTTCLIHIAVTTQNLLRSSKLGRLSRATGISRTLFLEYWSRPWPNDSGAERNKHDRIVVVTSSTIVRRYRRKN